LNPVVSWVLELYVFKDITVYIGSMENIVTHNLLQSFR